MLTVLFSTVPTCRAIFLFFFFGNFFLRDAAEAGGGTLEIGKLDACQFLGKKQIIHGVDVKFPAKVLYGVKIILAHKVGIVQGHVELHLVLFAKVNLDHIQFVIGLSHDRIQGRKPLVSAYDVAGSLVENGCADKPELLDGLLKPFPVFVGNAPGVEILGVDFGTHDFSRRRVL